MLRALAIGPAEKIRIQELITFAADHRIPVEILLAHAREQTIPPWVYDRRFHMEITHGFRLVFTIEQHPGSEGKPPVWCKHLSVSVEGSVDLPHPFLVQTIMTEFGMTGDRDLTHTYVEGGDGDEPAINVVQQITDVEAIIVSTPETQYREPSNN